MQQAEERCDVVVTGGGPGGSSCATMLAKAGKRVIVLEREKFPRFHIGESLLPGAWELWNRLGIIPKLEAEGFPPKQGINFGMFNQPAEEDVVLLTAEYPMYFERSYAFHVERARFDEIMLEHAASCGADTRQQWTVKELLFEGDVVSVGTVLDAQYAKTLGETPQERFDKGVANCGQVSAWLKGATQTMDMHTISHISYLNECFVGDGFVLVGDASMIIDPIFSAGVTIATRGGVYASDAILDCVMHQDFSAARLQPYEDRIRLPMSRIFKMIYNWYTILEKKDSNNIISRARKIPMLRDRFITLLSGGYEKVDMGQILAAAGEPDSTDMLR